MDDYEVCEPSDMLSCSMPIWRRKRMLQIHDHPSMDAGHKIFLRIEPLGDDQGTLMPLQAVFVQHSSKEGRWALMAYHQ